MPSWFTWVWARLRVLPSAFPRPVILWPAIVAIGLAGPFGTYETHGFFFRLIYWAAVIIGCGAVFNFSNLAVLTSQWGGKLARPLAIVLAAALAAPFAAALVYAVEVPARGISQGFDFYRWLVACVFVIGLAISLIQYRKPNAAEARLLGPNGNGTESRSPAPAMDGPVLSMSMQDHYVEVVRDTGTELVHGRFSDAIGTIPDRPGMQCHRSHWVALDAIRDAKLTGRNRHVVLSDGRRIPVSARYANKLGDMIEALQDG